MQKKIAEFIATIFYVGKIKYAPGTFGSLVAFPLCYLIMHCSLESKFTFDFNNFDFQEKQLISLLIIQLISTIIIFCIGIYATFIYIKGQENSDPKEVVIDELAGQMLTIICASFSVIFTHNSKLPLIIDPMIIDIILLFIMPFILFRLFDIFKPWPIDWIDQNIKGAFGVMFDDIMAAIFAIVVQYVLVFFIIDFFPISK